MSGLDYSIILIFIGYALFTGLSASKKASKNLEEYFLAGRSLKGWQAGLSLSATQFASDTPLLICGIIAVNGIFWLWQIWIYAMAFLLLGFVLAPCWRRAQVITDAELTNLRYGSRPTEFLRFFKAIYFGTIINCTVLAWVFFAAAKIAEPFLLWNLWLPVEIFEPIMATVQSVGVPLTLDPNLSPDIVWTNSANNFISVVAIVAVTFMYSATGGLRAVVATDIFQLGIMAFSTLVFALVLLHHVGGISGLAENLADLYNKPDSLISASQLTAFTPDQAKNLSWSFFMVILLQWIIQTSADGSGYSAQRSMACKTDHDAKIAGLVHCCFTIALRMLLWIPIALCLLVIYPVDFTLTGDTATAVREGKYVLAMAEFLPIGVKGIMVTAMLAALASTVDTHLNWGSSYWTNDIYKHFICEKWLGYSPSPSSLVWVARICNLLILIVAGCVATQLKSINDTWQIFLLLGAGVGVTLVLRWLWWRITAWSEAASIVSSVILAPVIYFNVDEQAVRLLLIAVICTAIAILVSFLMGPENHKTLKEFYERVRPPGFWGPFSKTPHEDSKRLFQGLTSVFLAAVTVFCVLVALGSFIASSTLPFGLPNWLGTIVLLLIASALTPIWWKLEFTND